MKNPCVALDAGFEGLSIKRSDDGISIVIERKLSKPLLLPDDHNIDIRLVPGASAHMLCSSAAIKLKLEDESQAFFYGISPPKLSFSAQVGAGSRLSIAKLNLAGDSSDTNLQIALTAPGAELSFIGLDQSHDSAVNNTRLHIIHETPHTVSTQAFRGIYAGSSMGTFVGKVTVAPHAAHSSVQQLYKSVLLSEQARAFVKPELEIDNYDIKASHGASIGQLDPEALFYLCSRGLSLNAARALLVKSMTAEILEAIAEPMRDFMSYQAALALEALA